MTIQRRTHPHPTNRNDDEESIKEHAPPRLLPRKVRRLSFGHVKDEVGDWLLLVTCAMVLFICSLWFLGKVFAALSWALPPSSLFESKPAALSAAFKERPFNPNYAIPHAHSSVGDRSFEYSLLRQDIDSIFPENPTRSLQRVQELQVHTSVAVMPTIALDHNSDQVPAPAYDIYNCPPTPPQGYPFQWQLLKLVEKWNPENTTVPSHIFKSLCTFNHEQDYDNRY